MSEVSNSKKSPQSGKLEGVWRTYDNTDGLLAGVNCLLQDRQGLLWLGTFGGGISCYDGVQFTNYTTEDGLPHNDVRCVYQDSAGRLWFGTSEGGVSCYDGQQFTHYTPQDGLPPNQVKAICEDATGKLWFGTVGGGVCCYDGQQFTAYMTGSGLAHNDVWAIFRDDEDRLWFGTRGGVNCYERGQFTNYTTEDGLPYNNVLAICQDTQGRLWFGTGIGISCYDGEKFTNYTTEDGLAHNEVWALYWDRCDRLWVGAFGGGVTCYDGEQFVVYTTDDGLPAECVTGILQDDEGSFWFALVSAGLTQFDPESFQTLCSDSVNSGAFIQDPQGRLWYGSYYQLGCIEGKLVKRRRMPAQIHDLLADQSGGLWLATWGEGVYHFRNRATVWHEEPEHFTTEHGLTDMHALSLAQDRAGRIWVGSENGDLCCYDIRSVQSRDGGRFMKVAQHSGAIALFEDSNGTLWMADWQGGGLGCYDGKHLRTYTVKDGLSANSTRWLLESRDGKLWICTQGGGVCCYDGERFECHSFAEGLLSAMVDCAYQDAAGHLWFGANGIGVHRYDGKNFQALTTQDGLPSSSVMGITQIQDGTMVFATQRGIVSYRSASKHAPRVITRQIVADKVYSRVSEVELTTSAASRVTFRFRGISFKTRRMRYNYKLEGYDADWIATWDEEAVYENLPPGEYTFAVIAINRDLVYSESQASVQVTVQPDPRDVAIASLQTEVDQLRREVGRKYYFENIVGRSAPIKQVYALMEKAIDSGLTVLLSGETGSGKEMVAKAIHYNSPRKNHPFLELNCGAVPKDLVASTLFGYRKGAFTGANEDSAGLFEAASGGTVLLDEISEMPNEAQVHLLRVLQEHKIQRVGETRLHDIDVRIIATTNRDLEAEVKAGRFREDLYYRLSIFPIHIPALRDRLDDIPLLAEHLLQKVCQKLDKEIDGFASGVFEILQSYRWPGNVRELENEIARAAALVEEGLKIQTYHFSSKVTRGESLIAEILSEPVSYTESVNRFRQRLVEEALRECGGNRTQAAKMLGIDRSNLIKLIRRLGIEEVE